MANKTSNCMGCVPTVITITFPTYDNVADVERIAHRRVLVGDASETEIVGIRAFFMFARSKCWLL